MVPAAVHAVEDEEDVEDNHLGDQVIRTSRLSIMIITNIAKGTTDPRVEF